MGRGPGRGDRRAPPATCRTRFLFLIVFAARPDPRAAAVGGGRARGRRLPLGHLRLVVAGRRRRSRRPPGGGAGQRQRDRGRTGGRRPRWPRRWPSRCAASRCCGWRAIVVAPCASSRVFLTLSRGGLVALAASLMVTAGRHGGRRRRWAIALVLSRAGCSRRVSTSVAFAPAEARERVTDLRRRHRPDRHLDGRLADGRGQAARGRRRGQLPDRLDPLPARARGADCAPTSSSTRPRSRTTPTWRCSRSWGWSGRRCS